MKTQYLNQFLIIVAAFACRPQEELASCTTSIATEGTYELIKPYKSGMLIVGTTFSDSWCNASIELVPSGEGFNAKIITAKHCVKPWVMRSAKLLISGKRGYLEANLESSLLNKFIDLSSTSSGAIKKLDTMNSFDYSQMFMPSKSPAADIYKFSPEMATPEIYRKFQSEIAAEESRYGQGLCDANFKTGSFPNKACFTTNDLFAFDAYVTVDEKYKNQIRDELNKPKPPQSPHAVKMVKDLIDRSNYEMELFVSFLWQNLRQCFPERQNIFMVLPENFDVCKYRKDEFMALFKTSKLYNSNKFFVDGIIDTSDDNYKKMHLNLENEYLRVSTDISNFVSMTTRYDTELTLLNNIKQGDVYKPALIDVGKVRTRSVSKKAYGYVVSVNPSKLNIFKGDSGSILLYRGVPVSALSTYEGAPISSGIATSIPVATEVPELEESSHGDVSSVEGSGAEVSEIGSVEVPGRTGPSQDGLASDGTGSVPSGASNPEVVVDVNSARTSGNCM